MTNNQLTDERLVKILSETQATIMEHNSRCVRGSVEVDARLFESMIMELQERRKAAMDSEPVAWSKGCNKSVPAALRYLAEKPRTIGGESSFNTAHLYQLAREIEFMAEASLYRHAQQPVVQCVPLGDSPYDVPRSMPSNLRELIAEEIGILFSDDDAQSVWDVCRRAAMLQAGNSPVIPDGLIGAVNRLLDSDGSRGCYSAIQCGDAHDEIERLLAAAPQEVK